MYITKMHFDMCTLQEIFRFIEKELNFSTLHSMLFCFLTQSFNNQILHAREQKKLQSERKIS